MHNEPSQLQEIMIVDDDPDLVNGFARLFRTMGYPVLTATSGEQALQLAEDHAPSAVIMDIMMPDTNGLEVYRRLREIHPGLNVIFMTGYSEMEHAVRAETGVAVLRKPLALADLLAELKKCF